MSPPVTGDVAVRAKEPRRREYLALDPVRRVVFVAHREFTEDDGAKLPKSATDVLEFAYGQIDAHVYHDRPIVPDDWAAMKAFLDLSEMREKLAP